MLMGLTSEWTEQKNINERGDFWRLTEAGLDYDDGLNLQSGSSAIQGCCCQYKVQSVKFNTRISFEFQ